MNIHIRGSETIPRSPAAIWSHLPDGSVVPAESQETFPPGRDPLPERSRGLATPINFQPPPQVAFWRRFRAVVAALVIVVLAEADLQAADGLVEAEADANVTAFDPSSWSPLPVGFLPGDGRILIERAGRLLRVDLPASFDVEGHDEARIRVGGDLLLRLAGRGGEGRGATMTILRLGTPGDRVPVKALVEAQLRGQEAALPARFQPPRDDRRRKDDRVVFLGMDGGGDDVARGLYDPGRDEGIDCGRIDPRFRFRLLRRETGTGGRSPGRAVRVSGSVPQGRELVLFDWRLRTDVLGAMRQRPLSTLSLHGWRLRGLSRRRLQGAVDALAEDTLLGSANYVEIGDGWQARRSGGRLFARLERSWLASLPLDPRSPDPTRPSRDPPREGDVEAAAPEKKSGGEKEGPQESVEPVVRSLAERGLCAGLWLVPHGQTADAVFEERPAAFVRDGKGRALHGNYLGPYVVDPTGAAGEAYLRELFRRLRATGARIFRVAGLDRALLYYRVNQRALQNGSASALEIVKRSLRVMREGAGEGALLAGDYGTPRGLAAELDAVRPSLREDQRNFTDLQREGLAVSSWLSLHRRLLDLESLPLAPRFFVNERDDLTATLRSYIFFAALTGRGVVLDGTWEAPEALRPLFLQIREPPEVYPLDIPSRESAPRERPAPIWVVKPSATDQDRSLVGLFNWGDLSPVTLRVAPSELGVRRPERGGRLLWFDLVSERFIGSGWHEHDFFLLPGHSRFLAVSVLHDTPRVLAVSGHVVGRELFLSDLRWDPERLVLRGRLRLEGAAEDDSATEPEGAPESKVDISQTSRRMHIAVRPVLRPVRLEADGFRADFKAAGGHVIATIRSPPSGGASSASAGVASPPPAAHFRLAFERAEEPEPVGRRSAIENVQVRYQASARRPLVSWQVNGGGHEGWRGVSGFAILRDGRVVGRTTDTRFLDDGVAFGGTHEYGVRPTVRVPAPEASVSADAVDRTFSFPAGEDTQLVNLFPRAVGAKSSPPARMRSATGGPLLVGGRRFRDGWGVRPPSRVDFRIDRGFAEFRAGIGVDDASRLQGSVVFVVVVDGREAYRSPLIEGDGHEPREIRVDTRGGRVMSLIVEDGGDGTDWDYADWCEPRMIVESEANEQSERTRDP